MIRFLLSLPYGITRILMKWNLSISPSLRTSLVIIICFLIVLYPTVFSARDPTHEVLFSGKIIREEIFSHPLKAKVWGD